MMQYSNPKPRLSPLIEVIEPTPPLCRNAPIFGMTTLNDSDFNLSDLTSETSEMTIEEDEISGNNPDKTKPSIPTYYLSPSTQKQTKTKLINNVNSYL